MNQEQTLHFNFLEILVFDFLFFFAFAFQFSFVVLETCPEVCNASKKPQFDVTEKQDQQKQQRKTICWGQVLKESHHNEHQYIKPSDGSPCFQILNDSKFANSW